MGEQVAERLEPVRERFRKNPELLHPLEKAGYETPDYVEQKKRLFRPQHFYVVSNK